MTVFKYILKRVGLLVCVFIISATISFSLTRLLRPEFDAEELGMEVDLWMRRRIAQGLDRPIHVQWWRYVRMIATDFDFGTSWQINHGMDVTEVIGRRLPPTIILSIYSMFISIPAGIFFGIWAAIKKNKLTDHIISTGTMLFISVPSFVFAFIMQYTLGFRMGLFPVVASSHFEAGGWFTWTMTHSLLMPTLALSFGGIAGFCRGVRAELTEAMTSDYMLLARAKGLTRSSAIRRHALRNSMVPIFPGILGTFMGIFSGSIIIEAIFAIGGMGPLILTSIVVLDYDVFIAATMFYLFIGLAAGIVIDMSYGFVDPRIRMGEK